MPKTEGDILRFLMPDDSKRKRSSVRRCATGGDDIQKSLAISDMDERQKKLNEENSRLYDSFIKEIIRLQKDAEEREITFSWFDMMQFNMFILADEILGLLEQQRDAYAPKHADDEWDPRFCEAIQMIPEAKMFARECMDRCIEVKKQ